ncbi:MAG TPA: CPBP family intramembrane glutamic endopeptidase [Bryobacteraceae bacterium]|nr:CPBP family intramembrane glutamic endopeptidase [Bryobacteraceae bacterium]
MITPEQGRSSGPVTTLEPPATVPPSRRKRQLLEVLVFLFLIVPSMVLSFFAGQRGKTGFNAVAWRTIVRDPSLISLIVYFLWRDGEPTARLGWRARNVPKEIFRGYLILRFAFLTRSRVAATVLSAVIFSVGHGYEGTAGVASSISTPRRSRNTCAPWPSASPASTTASPRRGRIADCKHRSLRSRLSPSEPRSLGSDRYAFSVA